MIVPGGSAARLRQRFRDQFARAGNGWVYRRAGRGAALPVSAPDMEAFVTAFDRALRRLFWGGVGSGMVLGIVLGATDRRWPAALAPHAFWIVAAPFLLGWGALFWLAWDAPHRVLAGRAPLAPALTGSAVRRQGLRTLPWSVLALGAAVTLGLVARVALAADPTGAAARGYYLYAAVLLAVFGALAIAKLRTR